MTQAFSPTEIFKRATASTLRAIAEREDVTVGFGPEPPGVSGSRVKLPNPARDLPADEAAQLRGAADSLALRLRYHDDALHSKRVPGNALARAVFEGLEQARVEALGSRRMVGVAANLTAMLDEQYRRQGFERITERTESTMADAVRLLTREALTREPPPPSARRVVDLWRPWLEGKIGKDIVELVKRARVGSVMVAMKQFERLLIVHRPLLQLPQSLILALCRDFRKQCLCALGPQRMTAFGH